MKKPSNNNDQFHFIEINLTTNESHLSSNFIQQQGKSEKKMQESFSPKVQSICSEQEKQDSPKVPSSESKPIKIESSLESIMCYFCQQIIVFAVEGICGHAFCQYCLSEYLLVARECPLCGIKIREKKWASDKRLDDIIQEFCDFLGNQAIESMKFRKETRRTLKEQKRLQNFNSGAIVDVRDEDYVWQKGRIIRTFNRLNSEHIRMKFLIIQYCESEKKQEFSATSTRLAKPGYFTDRDDIPHIKPNIISLFQKQNKKNHPRTIKKDEVEQNLQKGERHLIESSDPRKKEAQLIKEEEAQEDKQDDVGKDNIMPNSEQSKNIK